MRRPLITLLTLGLVVGTAAACQRPTAVVECLQNPTRPAVVRAWDAPPKWPSDAAVLPDDTPVDARGIDFDGSNNVGSKITYSPDSRRGLCLVGGTYSTSMDPDESPWSTVWHKRWGLIVQTPHATIIGPNLFNTGDGIMFEGVTPTNWTIIAARADGRGTAPGAFIHDDCVESDGMNSGRIIESKFDGCNVFLSAILDRRPGEPRLDGSMNTLVVRDTLVRLQPMKNSYNPDRYGPYQHGGFFKFSSADAGDVVGDGTPPTLEIHGSTFRADQPAAYGGNDGGRLGLPPGTVCTSATIIGWEAWPADEVATWEQACGDGLRKATASDWDVAVADWDASHPVL